LATEAFEASSGDLLLYFAEEKRQGEVIESPLRVNGQEIKASIGRSPSNKRVTAVAP
jgi:hypothetical protein